MINLTTGPVNILPEVRNALNQPEISHRSEEFIQIYNSICKTLSGLVSAKEVYIAVGSGTLANDIMLSQIKLMEESGLILSNGEFGERLIKQANCLSIKFETIKNPWGKEFNLKKIETSISQQKCKWILLCYCESSTGQLAPIEEIKKLCAKHKVEIYLDCMSALGTVPVNLQGVAMATGSSGKGIGSLSGLALILNNIKVRKGNATPLYLDLYNIKNDKGIPFTMSYNLLSSLHVAVEKNVKEKDWEQADIFSDLIYRNLQVLGVIPFSKNTSRIFTIVPKGIDAGVLGQILKKNNISTSYQSNYLKKRNWLQIALFSTYSKKDIEHVLEVLQKNLNLKEAKSILL